MRVQQDGGRSLKLGFKRPGEGFVELRGCVLVLCLVFETDEPGGFDRHSKSVDPNLRVRFRLSAYVAAIETAGPVSVTEVDNTYVGDSILHFPEKGCTDAVAVPAAQHAGSGSFVIRAVSYPERWPGCQGGRSNESAVARGIFQPCVFRSGANAYARSKQSQGG
ncbi:hypothetical protein RHSP_65055 [Rhizobium freirei PRF 81]|uniref:Uncharacterized protein n=1 Tax=Rhizobium freirei PRF 81 TaxID=363754 RepID=N6VC29_9HYPH|nr:hypothetical protein RHSP_65055 [Rhizobium freirei PRF 81]